MQPSWWARLSENRLRKISKRVPMSDCKSVCRSRTWRVRHTLYTSLHQDAALQLRPTSTAQPWTLFWNLFKALFQHGPDSVFYIHVRVSRAAFDECVACGRSGSALPDLPFTAVIQATRALYLAQLQSFLSEAEWTPVGAKLCSDLRYQNEFVNRIIVYNSKRSRSFSPGHWRRW